MGYKLSSTLRPVTSTSNAITTSATHTTATITFRPNSRVFGDRQHEAQYLGTQQRQVGYLPHNVPTGNASQGNQNNDIALASQQLPSSNEIASLPKSELLTFDSSSKNYNRFMASFKVNIENKKSIDDTTKLTYLIQYCEGESRSLIENCIMMNSTEGLKEAKRLLEQEYGKPHDIARSFIDSLTKASSISTNDHDGIIKLAHDMQKCYLTLTQLRYVSDLNSIATLYAIMNRLPDYLQQKWIERAAALNRNNKEPDFQCLLQFIQERAELLKTSFAKEHARTKAEKKP